MTVFEFWKLLHRNYFSKITRKFPGHFSAQRIHHAKGHCHKANRGQKSMGGAPSRGGRAPCPCGPHRWNYEGSNLPGSSLPLRTRPGTTRKNFSRSFAAHFSISKFGQPFSNPFGGIVHWYVTPPLIQVIFDMMLYIVRKLLFLVSHLMRENPWI